jgi:hypothetical protein
MDPDGESIKKIKKQRKKTGIIQRYISNVGNVLSTIWVRCCTIYVNVDNRKHLESQYYYVFYIGSIFYFLFFIAKTCE